MRTSKVYLILLALIMESCDGNNSGSKENITDTIAPVAGNNNLKKEKSVSLAVKKWRLADFYSDDASLTRTTNSIYNRLTDSEKAAQMIMIATSEYKGIGVPFSTAQKLYKQRIAGSVLFLKGRRSVFTRQIKTLNVLSQTENLLPAVYACDCESALFHKKFTDADSLLPASQLTTTEDVNKMAEFISTEMKKMGIHWNFAPVADISENKEIISTRSFGHDNDSVIVKSIAFIRASESSNIATSVKHFPGHGAVKGDSHKNLVYIDSSFRELKNFQTILSRARPVSVMVGHIAVKNIPGFSTLDIPATLSHKIVTGLLKDSLGFSGIVLTDAMNMGAVKNISNADFKAVIAGNDLILIPNGIERLHQKIMGELKSKSALGKRLSVSIKKMIRLKICLGLLDQSLN